MQAGLENNPSNEILWQGKRVTGPDYAGPVDFVIASKDTLKSFQSDATPLALNQLRKLTSHLQTIKQPKVLFVDGIDKSLSIKDLPSDTVLKFKTAFPRFKQEGLPNQLSQDQALYLARSKTSDFLLASGLVESIRPADVPAGVFKDDKDYKVTKYDNWIVENIRKFVSEHPTSQMQLPHQNAYERLIPEYYLRLNLREFLNTERNKRGIAIVGESLRNIPENLATPSQKIGLDKKIGSNQYRFEAPNVSTVGRLPESPPAWEDEAKSALKFAKIYFRQ